MVRPSDSEMIVVKEELYTHRSLETGGVKLHKGPCGEAPGSVRRQKRKEKEEHGCEPLLGFLWEELGGGGSLESA